MLIFGLGIGLLLLVGLLDPAGLVAVVNGEIKAAVTERRERKGIALHLAGLPSIRCHHENWIYGPLTRG